MLVLVDTAMAVEFACRRMLEQKQSTMGSNADERRKIFGDDGFRLLLSM
jgi:hypothetical protein